MGWEKNLENVIGEGVQKAGGKLGNPYLKISYKTMFFMSIPELIHLLSTSIYFLHTEISQNTLY